MKRFGKGLGILTACMLLVCAMIVTASAAPTENCPGSCTHQAAVGTTHYDTLAEAVAAVESGGTVTLLTDVTASCTAEKSLALDLGGKTLSGTMTFTKGGTVKNGAVSAVAVQSCTVAIEKDARLGSLAISGSDSAKAKVNLSGQISGTGPLVSASSGLWELSILKNAKITATEGPAVKLSGGGKLEVTGGTIEARTDCIQVTIPDTQSVNLSITGGKLLSQDGEAITVKAEGSAQVPKNFVTGGTFTKVPTAYVPSYAVIRNNADGTYTVISQYTLTFLPGDGTGSMDTLKVNCGSSVTLPGCAFTAPAGKDFQCWEIGGQQYMPGSTFTPTGDTTAKALWKAHTHSGGKATCQKKAVCQVCGESYGKKGSHNLSHSSGYAATCTAEGMSAYSKCKTCGKYYVNGVQISASALSLPALGHSWDTVSGTPATCTEDGLRLHEKCAACGILQIEGAEVTEDALLIPATGHAMETVAASQATCAQPGIQAHEHCTTCDGQFLNGEAVEAAQLTTASSSHVLSDWLSDEHYHWKSCVDCGEVFRQNSHADKDADGSCDDCGYAVTADSKAPQEDTSSGFSFLFLIPLVAAVAIAVPLAVRKRK